MSKFIKLIPNIFYSDIGSGLKLFVETLNFTVVYKDPEAQHPFYIINRDGVSIHLIEDKEFAEKDRPEIRIETDDIEGLYKEVSDKEHSYFHPNLSYVRQQPWGLKEFALLDEEGTCIIIQQ